MPATPEQSATLRVGCKINLGLRLVGLREDGYHLIDSVFLPLPSPSDTMRVTRTDTGEIEVRTAEPGIDRQNNTITKAWKSFCSLSGEKSGFLVELEKGIPWGAGLGGGSADAAALLTHMNALAQRPLSKSDLLLAAQRVGADVPFFLGEGPMRVTGIGEKLAPCVPDLPSRHLLLVTPDVQVSTPWAYKAYDALGRGEPVPDPSGKTAPPLTKDVEVYKDSNLFCSAGSVFVNDLELPVFLGYPEVAEVKRALLEQGACAASMSGSGSAVFGFFKDEGRALQAREIISEKWRVTSMLI